MSPHRSPVTFFYLYALNKAKLELVGHVAFMV